MKYGIRIAVLLLLALTGCDSQAQQEQTGSSGHPKLILTQDGVAAIRPALGTVPLLDSSIASVKAEVDAEIAAGIDTPIPEDYSGGYTHERHKQNFFVMQKAGALYQILDDEKYANYVRDMLLQYEAMYKDLPLHPKTRSYARGKLFWQCLNDANWLVYASQAYDAIYDYLSEQNATRSRTTCFVHLLTISRSTTRASLTVFTTTVPGATLPLAWLVLSWVTTSWWIVRCTDFRLSSTTRTRG